MKVVKLRKTQTLYKRGFTHAFKFTKWDEETGSVLAALNKIYNNRQWRGRYWAWEVSFTDWKPNPEDGLWKRSTFIGVRSEAVISQVLLIL